MEVHCALSQYLYHICLPQKFSSGLHRIHTNHTSVHYGLSQSLHHIRLPQEITSGLHTHSHRTYISARHTVAVPLPPASHSASITFAVASTHNIRQSSAGDVIVTLARNIRFLPCEGCSCKFHTKHSSVHCGAGLCDIYMESSFLPCEGCSCNIHTKQSSVALWGLPLQHLHKTFIIAMQRLLVQHSHITFFSALRTVLL